MKVLKISKENMPEAEKKAFEYHGVFFSCLSPTPLSAFTSLKISGRVKKDEPEIVEVCSLKDAMAAISARKLNLKQNFKIVYYAAANSEVPRAIPAEITKEVDGWRFASRRLLQAYPTLCKNAEVIPDVSMEYSLKAHEDAESKTSEGPKAISWIGPIINTARLKAAIEAVDSLPCEATLRVCGQGQAKHVMPLVRYTRGLDNKHRIVWKGEEYDTAKEIAQCSALVISDTDISPLEHAIARLGVPLLIPSEIEAFVTEGKLPEIHEVFGSSFEETLKDYYVRIREV